MSSLQKLTSALLATTALVAVAGTAQAATLAGLVDGKSLAWIDTDKKAVTQTVAIKGDALLAIDVRPSDGKLYGVTASGAIVTVDAKTGEVTAKSQISEKLPAGATISVDFNPAADRMRLIASDGTSLRINVEDGKAVVDGSLKFSDTDAGKGKTPKAVAVAYTNSFAGTKETALYDIDATTGAFVKQVPPNDGVVNTVGMVGVKFDGPVAFDILSDGKGGNTAWLVTGGTLHTIDIASGKAKAMGKIGGLKGKVLDIAAMPAN